MMPARVILAAVFLTAAACASETRASDVYSGLSEIPVDSEIEVDDLSFEVLVDDGSRVEVVYLGERCARSVENRFSSTTVAGDESNVDGTVNSGTVVFGGVECFEIGGDRSADASFVAVSGQWFVELLRCHG